MAINLNTARPVSNQNQIEIPFYRSNKIAVIAATVLTAAIITASVTGVAFAAIPMSIGMAMAGGALIGFGLSFLSLLIADTITKR